MDSSTADSGADQTHIEKGTEELTSDTLIQIFQMFAGEVAAKLHAAATPQTKGQKVAQFAKDFGPLFTGVAALLVSLSIGALTVTISVLTYKSNTKQAAANQISLRTTALNDFAETDKEKRDLAAIKVAAYGEEALPIIRFALGVSSKPIRSGGAASAQMIYQADPACRQKLLETMLLGFQDPNPTLRLGILEFYSAAVPQLTQQEQAAFWSALKNRLGPGAQSCVNENGDFVFAAVQFLANGLFPDSRDFLMNIVRNCPHEKGNQKYDGARNQAIGVLPIVLQNRRATKAERDQVVNDLRGLQPEASEELQVFLRAAITNIEKIKDP